MEVLAHLVNTFNKAGIKWYSASSNQPKFEKDSGKISATTPWKSFVLFIEPQIFISFQQQLQIMQFITWLPWQHLWESVECFVLSNWPY